MTRRLSARAYRRAGRRSETIGIGRVGWIGLICAAIGWALLLAEAALADLVSIRGTRAIALTFHDDIVSVAKCLIGSGFGLAIVGALQNGFGTLNGFFEAVLARSSRRGMAADQRAEPVVMERERRPYRTLPDGSVEVETILGTRRFATMSQARDFI